MTARELADWLILGFDRRSAMAIEQALADVLRARGFKKFQADDIAFTMGPGVLTELRNRAPEELPFRFARADETRLVGKERLAERDTPETTFAKQAWALADELLEHLVTVDPKDFEVVCAAAVMLSGAQEMRALCTGDEGGIDFYGRLLVRPPSERVEPGILHTTVLPKRLLILGQAKRYSRIVHIGRPDIQKFKGQLDECLDKYEGNVRPPTHRVPDSYYERGEPYLGVFATTASFAETADASAFVSGVVLVPGEKLAQFLVYKEVGIVKVGEKLTFSRDAFAGWLRDEKEELT